jgi:hypothetical protein
MTTVVDMVQHRTNATHRYVNLCTTWVKRGTDEAMKYCLDQHTVHGFIHPYKISVHGYMAYDLMYDKLQ